MEEEPKQFKAQTLGNITQKELYEEVMRAFPKTLQTSKISRQYDAFNTFKSIKNFILSEDIKMFLTGSCCLDQATDKMENYECFPMLQYGAMVILCREIDEQYPKMLLTFPTWDFGIEPSYPTIGKIFPINSSNYEYLHVGQIKIDQSLPDLKDRVQRQLKLVIQKMKASLKSSKKKFHHTPTWLLQALFQVLHGISKNIDFFDEKLKIEFLSKGGTYDVGQHIGITEPEVGFGIIWSALSLMLQNSELLDALQFIYKLALLNDYVRLTV